MCLAIPGKVIKIEGRKALVQYPGVTNAALISDEKVKVGDMVIVQMGIIINKVNKKQATAMQKAWENK
ncbi:HypC/HybG/HupF family hydrogenase formation chaperone [Candidatus Beckwithbacteria bacterium]|nr:HypC/HybG/HupF family hydrogenase formation chaperone [Candidatus Beckwithbacteria bacterium]